MCKICAFSQTKTTKRQKVYTGRRSRYISWTVFGIDHLLLGRCFFKFSSQKKAGQAFYLSNDPPTSPTKKNPFNNKKTCKDSFWKPTKKKIPNKNTARFENEVVSCFCFPHRFGSWGFGKGRKPLRKMGI